MPKFMTAAFAAATFITAAFVATLTVTPAIAAGQNTVPMVYARNCGTCHKVGPDAVSYFGPELNGLDGRPAGILKGYSYSAALKNSGIVWNEQNFLDYIKDPRKKVPGTKMSYPPVRNEQDALALWSYLKQIDASGQTVAAAPTK